MCGWVQNSAYSLPADKLPLKLVGEIDLQGGSAMAVYVVTGGGGFIGSHIVEELVRRNETVKVIDNFSTGKRENVKPFKNRAEIIDADIAEAKDLARFLKAADYVIHQAAIPSVPKSIIDPLKSHHANVNGTL